MIPLFQNRNRVWYRCDPNADTVQNEKGITMANFTHDDKQQRYQVEVAPKQWARLDYSIQGDVLVITHTFVPDALRGRGCGKILMETVLSDIEHLGKKVKPVCSYAVVYLQRHTQWQHLIG